MAAANSTKPKFKLVSLDRARELLDYDPSTGIFRWRVPVGGSSAGQRAGFLHGGGYRFIGIGGSQYPEHRMAWLLHYGVPPRSQIDHIDRDPTNNRIANLRIATTSQNNLNRGRPRNNTSGVKGVTWTVSGWQVRVQVRGKRRFVGLFDSLEEAARRYQDARAEMIRENFGDMVDNRLRD